MNSLIFQGNFGQQEDKKHRATYRALADSEEKLKFYSARQIACRVLGSKGYLCQKVQFQLVLALMMLLSIKHKQTNTYDTEHEHRDIDTF